MLLLYGFFIFALLLLDGVNVNGICKLPCPIPITLDLKCGSNDITYQNEQELLCAKIHCDPNLYLSHKGPCGKGTGKIPNTNFKINFSEVTSTDTRAALEQSLPVHHHQSKVFSPRLPIKKVEIEVTTIPSSIDVSSTYEIRHSGSGNAIGSRDCLDDCVCELVLAPVCGSNQVTYGNHCLLECVQNCEPGLVYHHEGFCAKIMANFCPLVLRNMLTTEGHQTEPFPLQNLRLSVEGQNSPKSLDAGDDAKGDNSGLDVHCTTEYQRAFGHEIKKVSGEDGTTSKGTPHLVTPGGGRRPHSTKNLLYSDAGVKDAKMDLTTSYMHAFKPKKETSIPIPSPPTERYNYWMDSKNDRGETMEKLLYCSDYLPSPYPKEKRVSKKNI